MAKPKDKALTYDMVMAEVLKKASAPLPVQELATQMLAALPSSARNPMQAMRAHIRRASGRRLVFLDADTILPIQLAYQGARFRVMLERESFNKGLLPLDKLASYLPNHTPIDRIRLVDVAGKTIPFQIKAVSQTIRTFSDPINESESFVHLSAWYRSQKMYVKDHILVTVLDWEQCILQLERESFGQRNQALLAERNHLLAEMFFALLESAPDDDILVPEAVPTVYARMPDKGGYPAGHWWDVLEEDGRMDSNGWTLFYRDSPKPFRLWDIDDLKQKQKPVAALPLSDTAGKQVYRFRAHLLHRPKIWREIEIQGEHTLADLDVELRSAFNHDALDHLGGFWKLVPRAAQAKTMARKSSGKSTRYREVELGDVDPFGEGEGAETRIADLELAVGDVLKYVYDFGDWIEHHLALQAIEAPQDDAVYPREVGHNQPEYAYCVECQKKGKQTVARWVCLHCSTGPENEVLLCEKCVEKHEDHYVEEILY